MRGVVGIVMGEVFSESKATLKVSAISWKRLLTFPEEWENSKA